MPVMATRLLIVDDRPQDRFLARRALAAEFPDLVLTEAGDRAQVDAALDGSVFDAIITDYVLLWTDGLQLLDEVRQRGLETPVVMFTHTGSEEVAAAGLRAGLADYIIKTPSHYGRLAHAVRIALKNAATARSEREARLHEQEALRTAEEALRLKDDFLATLSHELRTPLNAISGWLQVIKSQPGPERLERGLTAIERNTGFLTRLIADLVDVSRIVSGTLTLQVQPTDVRKVVESVLDSVRPVVQAKRLTVEMVSPSNLDPVAVDPDRFQQMVWNLLSNAVKFTPPDGRICIRTAQDGTQVELSVSDSGPGIRAEFLPRVFDRFSQQDSGMAREHGGLGLGLAIVRHLAEMHGGSVSVDSTEGHGATFCIRVPIADPAIAAPPPPVSGVRGAQLGGVRVLVVDDDLDARDFVAKMLGDQGALVAAAGSAAEGFDVMARYRPDVLVCDIGMPNEDGLAFIARVRKNGTADIASIPALAVTAYAREQDRQQSLLAGFDSHLAKPFSAEELVSIVRRLARFKDPGRPSRSVPSPPS
jgi:signal transduction histidine kinase